MTRSTRSLSSAARLGLETLEARLALSWAGVPPATVPVPTSAVAVTLNASSAASGAAAITTTEVDYYSFVATRGGSYRVNALTPSSNLDPVLGVFNASGQRVAYNDDISLSNTDSQLTVNLTAGQRYYVGVTNYTGTPGGAYSWSIQGPAAAVVDDRYEENDTLATATNLGTLTARQTLTGLTMADTADWFRFAMTGAGTSTDYVSIAFTHAQGDLDLRLYDSAGTLVRYSDGSTNSERIALTGLAAGTYYVQVYGYRGAANPSYTLDILPGLPTSGGGGGGGGTAGNRMLYLNFDGYAISRTELVRWAGTDWASSLSDLDADRNGITVGRFLASRADREQIIARMLQLVQEDLRPFGIIVQRRTGGAVEGVGATTIFLGPSSLSNGNYHVACDVDQGNNNRTDIAFVGNEDWGTVERTALAMADVTLHEAGHTWGLWHVNSGTAAESMGLRYSQSNQNMWVQNTAFLNRTFAAYVDAGGYPHGPGPQNSYQAMLRVFPATGTAAVAAAPTFTADLSRAGVFTVTTTAAGVDRVTLRRLASGNIEVTVNGQVYELLRGYRQVIVNTGGDLRDTVTVLNHLGGVGVTVRRAAGLDIRGITKGDAALRDFWSGDRVESDHGVDSYPALRPVAAPAQAISKIAINSISSQPEFPAPVVRERVSDAVLTAWLQVAGRRRAGAGSTVDPRG